MFVRAYLRASTSEQNALRAQDCLDEFAQQHGHRIAARYVENASGASEDRSELRRLLEDAQPGDILLTESVDRLSRLPKEAWARLKSEIESKGLRVVSLDLPTSHAALSANSQDEFTSRMLDAINDMLLQIVAAVARKDYDQRRERQQQGIQQAKAAGRYKGRPTDFAKRQRIRELLSAGFSIRKTAELASAAPSTVQIVKREML